MRTALYQTHVALGAKMVTFSGWEMPLYYQDTIEEHLTVRKAVGLFDISHMGRIIVKGPDAEKLLDYLSTNQIADRPDYSVTYTPWCHADGGTVDDMLIYRHHSDSFSVVVNAGNRQKDLQHLHNVVTEHHFDVTVEDTYATESILALQGPEAETVINRLFPETSGVEPMHFIETHYAENPIILSKTGYTGAGGWECCVPSSNALQLWNELLEAGHDYAIAPIGLGARDTLRLEKGYALYGHELTDQIAPTESICRWTVRWDKADFMGKQALEKIEERPGRRIEHGIILLEPGIAREGYPVWLEDEQIGIVTSGSYSPSLQRGIAIILVTHHSIEIGDLLDVQIRKNRVKAKVVKLPFL